MPFSYNYKSEKKRKKDIKIKFNNLHKNKIFWNNMTTEQYTFSMAKSFDYEKRLLHCSHDLVMWPGGDHVTYSGVYPTG